MALWTTCSHVVFGQKCPNEQESMRRRIVMITTVSLLPSKVQVVVFALFRGAVAKFTVEHGINCVVLWDELFMLIKSLTEPIH